MDLFLDVYFKVWFVLLTLSVLFVRETTVVTSSDRAWSYLIFYLPVFGRLFGWW